MCTALSRTQDAAVFKAGWFRSLVARFVDRMNCDFHKLLITLRIIFYLGRTLAPPSPFPRTADCD
jgi:hypothetical protein